MWCLILLIIMNLIFIVTVLLTVKSEGYYFLYNLSVIPLTAAAVFLSGYKGLIIIAVSIIFSLSFLIVHVDTSSIIQTLLLFIICIGAGYYLRYLTARVLNLKEKVLDVVQEQKVAANELNEKAEADKLYLEKAVYNISSLYQAPKKMISCTTLDELLDCIKKTVDGYFTFSKVKIMILSSRDKEISIDKIYNIPEKKRTELEIDGYENSLLYLMKDMKGPLVVDRSEDAPVPQGLSLSEDIQTFLAVPLIVGDRLNGIFAVEGVSEDDMIRFIILAHQFSMVLERIRLYEMVQEMAIRDGLTNVFVRRYFVERLNEEVKRAQYFNTRLSFMMIDIDYFKKCNDKYGHMVGDIVLRDIAKILKKNLREIDVIGRYGGEEFSVILPETMKDDAVVVGERLRRAVEDFKISAYDEMLDMTISIGVATYPDDTSDFSQLIDRADQMLYKAKEEGRNRIRVFG